LEADPRHCMFLVLARGESHLRPTQLDAVVCQLEDYTLSGCRVRGKASSQVEVLTGLAPSVYSLHAPSARPLAPQALKLRILASVPGLCPVSVPPIVPRLFCDARTSHDECR
jgi:hypothetical protein